MEINQLTTIEAGSLPLVSVITPTLNSELYIESTINSVLNQDYPNIEYIIIDGQSTDSTIKIIEGFGSRISYWESTPDTGMYNAINKGLRRAKGDILCYLNSDDCFYPSTVGEAVKFFVESSRKLALVYGDVDLVDANGYKIRRHHYPEYNQLSYISCNHSLIGQPSAFWTKEIFQEIGPFDENLVMAGDFDLFSRISVSAPGAISHSNKIAATFRIHSDSLSSTQKIISAREVKQIQCKYYYLIKEASVSVLVCASISRLNYRLRNAFEKLSAPFQYLLVKLVG